MTFEGGFVRISSSGMVTLVKKIKCRLGKNTFWTKLPKKWGIKPPPHPTPAPPPVAVFGASDLEARVSTFAFLSLGHYSFHVSTVKLAVEFQVELA